MLYLAAGFPVVFITTLSILPIPQRQHYIALCSHDIVLLTELDRLEYMSS